MADWSDEELRAAVHAYLTMREAQISGKAYSKADVRRELQKGPLRKRSAASIEYRMRNISAVLSEHGGSTLTGYLPAANVGKSAAQRIWSLISETDHQSIARRGISGARAARSLPMKPPKMIYFNIGWMKRYSGPDADDPTIGGHGYLGLHKHGAEAFNFLPTEDGHLRGYRPPGSREQTRIERLGVGRRDDYIDNVTVVWLAREPGTGLTLIVGWYVNARVYRHARPSDAELNNENHHYSVEALAADSRLLPPVARTFVVASSRTAKGAGFGQKPTWYGAETVNTRAWAYIRSVQGGQTKGSPPSKPPKNHDPELRRKVERAAVDHAVAYYKELYGADCRVESVETDARGWDLEVFCESGPLLVEVKGLMNAGLTCELTPNEYEKMMMTAHRKRYVIYIVNNALAQAPAVPISSIFRNGGGRRWLTQDGRELIIREKTGAVLTCA